MRYLLLTAFVPVFAAAAQPPAATPDACTPGDSTPGTAGLGRAAGVYTLTLVGERGARAVGTLFLRPPGADTLGPEGFRLAEAGSVTVSLAPFGVRGGPDGPPGLTAWPLTLDVFERRAVDAAGPGAPARVRTVLYGSEKPRLAPGQVATGWYERLVLFADGIEAGRLHGRWRSPLLGWRGGYFCAERR